MKSRTAKILNALLFASLLTATLGVQPAYAATISVDSNSDIVANDGSCTLREAIINANNVNQSGSTDCAAGTFGNDTITFTANFTITLGSQLPNVINTITINGNGPANTIIQAAVAPNTATYRVFVINGSSTLNLNNLTVRNGVATPPPAPPGAPGMGGAILNAGTLTIANSTISGNRASDFGGGIANINGNMTIINSTISGNSALFGGGVLNSPGTVTISSSTISGNSATNGSGGGILTEGILTLTNSTVSGNSATNGLGGGGIFNSVNSTLTITNSTLSGNSVNGIGSSGGGIFNSGGSTVTVTNSIIAIQTSGSDCAGGGTITSGGNNLESGTGCGFTAGGDQQNTDPLLGPLANNGGPTQTRALLPGSPALNTANALICASAPVSGRDQRGVTRPQGAQCDIGAYELDNTFPTVVTHSLLPSYTTGPSAFTVTFSENLNDPPGNLTDDATNPANYLLVEAGANGVFNTTSCAGGLATDDTQATVSGVTYNPGTFASSITLSSALPNGQYRLFVCGVGATNIVDIALNALNNGATDFTFNFIVRALVPTPTLPVPVTVTGGALPNTGFTPNHRSSLPAQPASLAYTALGDIWLEIPALQVKTSIVGIPKSNNTWNVDWLGKDAGWLHGTAFPSWEGNSVLTAHVYDAYGLPGPFVNLKDLKYGDQVIVHMPGEKYIFEVREVRTVPPTSTRYALKHLEDYSYLTLITCLFYDEKTDSYLYRRVVRAVLVNVQAE